MISFDSIFETVLHRSLQKDVNNFGTQFFPCNTRSPGGFRLNVCVFLLTVPLGSIPELPAESCKEIKASEGGLAVSGKYWLDSIIKKKSVLVHCDMNTEGMVLKYTQDFSVSDVCFNGLLLRVAATVSLLTLQR